MVEKNDESVEIQQKSYDVNLAILHDENLEVYRSGRNGT